MERKQFVCDKCGCQHYTSDQFQATGGNFAKIFGSIIFGVVTLSE